MKSKDVPMLHKYKGSEGHYTYHCPICDTEWTGYPIPGRCKSCGQFIVFREEDLNANIETYLKCLEKE